MLTIHPAFQALISMGTFVIVALGLWIGFTRLGSRQPATTGWSTPPNERGPSAGDTPHGAG
jgi:hypothetical protein